MLINARIMEYRIVAGYAGDGTTPVLSEDALVAPLPAELRDPSESRANALAQSLIESPRLLVVSTRALDAQGLSPVAGDRAVVKTLVPKRDPVAVDVASVRRLDGGRITELVVTEVRDGVAPAGTGGREGGES